MKPSQICLQTHRQCYRGTRELERWTSRIKAIAGAKARIGGKTITEISSSTRNSGLCMHTLFLSEKTKHGFPGAETCRCESEPWFSAGARQLGRANGVGHPLRSRGGRE